MNASTMLLSMIIRFGLTGLIAIIFIVPPPESPIVSHPPGKGSTSMVPASATLEGAGARAQPGPAPQSAIIARARTA